MSLFQVTQGGTGSFSCTFYDELGALVTPKTLKWTLSDRASNIINSRSRVTVSPIANPQIIVLSGLDLKIADAGNDNGLRTLLAEWTYDSVRGSDLPGRAEYEFSVAPTVVAPL
jgi:hypothetical protein